MKKIVALTLACLMAASLSLTGCSVRQSGNNMQFTGNNSGSGNTGSDSGNSGDREVNVCSWGEYIDESLIDEFEAATGITVNYVTVESNEALYSQLQQGGVNYDVIVPSDYMISQLIEEDMLAELDYDKIPNFSLIGDQFKNLSYDPENKYTVPYTWGTLGIIYNSTMVDGEITSWDAMFDPQYAGNVLMIRNSRDAFGIALMDLGYFPLQLRVIDCVSRREHRNSYAYIFIHEFALYLGRFFGCGLFIVLTLAVSDTFAIRYALLIIGVIQLISIPIARGITHTLDQSER